MKRVKRPIKLLADMEYKLVTIKMNHKGVFLRELKKGSEIKSNMYEIKEGDFILSGIDARNGAFGIVPPELDGAIVTNDFWYFDIDESVINKQLFLQLTSTTWFDDICKRGSDGTTQRIRLQKNKFLNQEIYLPSPNIQNELLIKIHSVKSKQNTINKNIIDQLEQINQLKQAILQEAIQGKLTENWRAGNPDIEPANYLLTRIKAAKKRMNDERKAKIENPFPPINKEDIPFTLPNNWIWCRLGEIYNFIDYRGKTPTKIKSGIRLLTAKNVRFGYLDINPQEFISELEYSKRMTRGFPKNGDLLFTTEAPLGNVSLLDLEDKEISTGQRVITFQSPLNDFKNHLILFFLMSPLFQKQLQEQSSGVTASGIKASRLRNILIPLPPQDEQKYLAEKIHFLLQQCKDLETEIKCGKIYTNQLIASVIKEAFEPGKIDN